jgi:hypothetical protein
MDLTQLTHTNDYPITTNPSAQELHKYDPDQTVISLAREFQNKAIR